MIMQIRRVA